MSYESDMLWVPSKSQFADISGGVATTTDVDGGISITGAVVSSHSVLGMDAAVPVGAYTLTAKLDFNGGAPQGLTGAYGIHLSDGTGLKTFGPYSPSVGVNNVLVESWTNRTTQSAADVTLIALWFTHGAWLRVSDDGTGGGSARVWSVSRDGVNFTTVLAESRTAFITPTRIGFFIDPDTTAVSATLTHWRVT